MARRRFNDLRAEKQHLKEEWAAMMVQVAWRGKKARRVVSGLREQLMTTLVIKVQCIWRSKVARRRAVSMRDALQKERERAAIRLACNYRGFKERARRWHDFSSSISSMANDLAAEKASNELLSEEIRELHAALAETHSKHVESTARLLEAHGRIEEHESSMSSLQSSWKTLEAEYVTYKMSSEARLGDLEREKALVQEELSSAKSEVAAALLAHGLVEEKLKEATAKHEEEKMAHMSLIATQMAADAAARKLEEELSRLREELSATVQREQVTRERVCVNRIIYFSRVFSLCGFDFKCYIASTFPFFVLLILLFSLIYVASVCLSMSADLFVLWIRSLASSSC
jgi:hypothetical protein